MSRSSRPASARLLLLWIGLAPGCARRETDELTIATNWPPAACEAIEHGFASGTNPVPLRWVRVGATEDPTRVVERRSPVDVVLGGPPASHARLAARGRLAPLFSVDARPWRLVGTSEGVSVIAGSPRAEAARAFVASLGEAGPAPPSSSFRADLEDATRIEARPELLAAKSALAARENVPKRVGWMDEPPPWPPASITRMRTRPDGRELIAVLAAQVAPDPEARAWLLESFDRVPKAIDDAILLELDEAAGGRLAAEPRFRAWLRSEWFSWARQRYRRVVRNLSETGAWSR